MNHSKPFTEVLFGPATVAVRKGGRPTLQPPALKWPLPDAGKKALLEQTANQAVG